MESKDKKEESFKIAEKCYSSIRKELLEDMKYKVEDAGATSFSNSNYLHCLQMTDYCLQGCNERLYISSKGFLRLYKALEDGFKKAIEDIKEKKPDNLKVIVTEQKEEYKKYFVGLGIPEKNIRFYTDTPVKPVIIADDKLRVAEGKIEDVESADVGDIKAEVLISKVASDDLAEQFEKIFNQSSAKLT